MKIDLKNVNKLSKKGKLLKFYNFINKGLICPQCVLPSTGILCFVNIVFTIQFYFTTSNRQFLSTQCSLHSWYGMKQIILCSCHSIMFVYIKSIHVLHFSSIGTSFCLLFLSNINIFVICFVLIVSSSSNILCPVEDAIVTVDGRCWVKPRVMLTC